MQQSYLDLLSKPVQDFVIEVEQSSGLPVDILPDARLNVCGPKNEGAYRIEVESGSILLRVPTNGYVSNGGLRHEMLHVKRFYVDKEPRLSLAEYVDWDPTNQRLITAIDNYLEHLIIVPIELTLHPERRAHWEQEIEKSWILDGISSINRRILACLNWTFVRHVLKASSTSAIANKVINTHGLAVETEAFHKEMVPVLSDKLTLVRMFFDWFGELPRDRFAVEYLDGYTGSKLYPIPTLPS